MFGETWSQDLRISGISGLEGVHLRPVVLRSQSLHGSCGLSENGVYGCIRYTMVYHGIPSNCPSLITEMVISYWIWDDLGVFHFQTNQLVVSYKWIDMNPTSRDVSG